MIAPIAPVTVQNLGPTGWTAARARIEAAAAAPAGSDAGQRSAHSASVVALAPAAMSALIEAQEHMAGDATPSDRIATATKIDHILARLAETPAGRPTLQPAPGGFSVQMLIAARQQLRDTYA